MPREIVYQGAEAIIYLESGRIVKDRVVKGYRHVELDTRIRKSRTRAEGRLLDKARRAGVDTPRVLESDESKIEMEYVDGKKLKDCLDKLSHRKRQDVYKKIGESIARMHANGIIHGDLTTSNMILHGNKVYFVDFGLGKSSGKTEDQATDLYLLHEAIKSTHLKQLQEAWDVILNAYKDKYTRSKEVITKITKISKRRRYMGE
ncbi:MAG: KEOPS complex kinase/ATPase Bud32 [Candidatus Aenigmatarchaeota archaeon]